MAVFAVIGRLDHDGTPTGRRLVDDRFLATLVLGALPVLPRVGARARRR